MTLLLVLLWGQNVFSSACVLGGALRRGVFWKYYSFFPLDPSRRNNLIYRHGYKAHITLRRTGDTAGYDYTLNSRHQHDNLGVVGTSSVGGGPLPVTADWTDRTESLAGGNEDGTGRNVMLGCYYPEQQVNDH